MTLNRKSIVFAQIALVALLALTATGSLFAQSPYYKQITTTQVTNSQTPVAITGLSFNLPVKTAAHGHAVVTLNMPNTYLYGPDGATGQIAGFAEIEANGAAVCGGQVGTDGWGTTDFAGTGRKNMTLVCLVPLTTAATAIQATFHSLPEASNVGTEVFASLSAVLTK